MTSSITITGAFTVNALAGKSGKFSKGATNAASLVQGMTQAGVIGAALSSTGAVGNTARAAISAHVVTLEKLLAVDLLDGGQWGNLLALCVGKFGVATFNGATMRGKHGARDYLTVSRNAAVLAFDLSDTIKGQERARATMSTIDAVSADVTRLIDAAQAVADAAQALLLLADAGLTDAPADAPADTLTA